MPFVPTGDPEDDLAEPGVPRLKLLEIGELWYVRGFYRGVRVGTTLLNARGSNNLALERAQREVADIKRDILSGRYLEDRDEDTDSDIEDVTQESDEVVSKVVIGPLLKISALVRQKLDSAGRSRDDLSPLIQSCWDDFEALPHRWLAKNYFVSKLVRRIPEFLKAERMTEQEVQVDLDMLAEIWSDHFADSGTQNPYAVQVAEVLRLGEGWDVK
jgi:hypothetical protein